MDKGLLTDRDQLIEYHVGGERPPEDWSLGTEYECFGFRQDDAEPLHYDAADGGASILRVLECFASLGDFEPIMEQGALIGLKESTGASITLEPAGQFELSGAPFSTVHETRLELDTHITRLRQVGAMLGVQWLFLGHHPVHGLDALDWMPKRRYRIMRDYLPTRGKLARYMMQTTCTVQANLDYRDEGDMGSKLRASMGASSLMTALFANSSLSLGGPNGYCSYRQNIWRYTDPDRSGLLPWVFEGAPPSYEQYVEYALDVPLFFILRGDEYIDCSGLPFREFWRKGFDGHVATIDDWVCHLSTLFPDVRLKHYLELRAADCVPPAYICALPALGAGLLYEGSALDATWDLVKGWTWAERQEHRHAVAREGLHAAAPGGHRTLDLARELLAIARYGLGKRAASGGYLDESCYLEPLDELVRREETLASRTLSWLQKAQTPSPRQILDHFALTRS